MKEIIVPIISAVISSLITAIVTIAIQKRKERRADNIYAKKKEQLIFERRPAFEIVDYKNYITRIGYGIKQKCDIDAFITIIDRIEIHNGVNAIYREKFFEKENWCCIIYKLKNTGQTNIKLTDLICNHQQTKVIFESNNANEYLRTQTLNYCVSLDKKIRMGDEITLKICFHKDCVFESLFDSILCIGIVDENNNNWIQPLFIPENKIYDSYRITKNDYNKRVKTDIAEECFKKPYLW